ncbi:DUF3021 domain-containing protein [Lacticaseibacillus pantheris]|uniref:DUF3021 domain-containing protein n=1 Tax=Lacticaseibacillus pantheris TaxID=171523 RepID=UPI0026588F7F|nr:DUF3021 domain-containing protein [Lacticaseibacillus pantheris]WKF84046.1 DUF3021 domain-containing protein [Lacticaseibacillus pantheris]
MVKKIARNTITGIGFGSFAYVLVLLFKVQTTMPTTANIISILVMSAGIGWISLVFESDALTWLAELGIHFVGTLLLVTIMMGFNGWLLAPSFWIVFVVLYVAFWIIIRVQHAVQVQRINAAIVQRRQKLKGK